jgi:hypothetical protein
MSLVGAADAGDHMTHGNWLHYHARFVVDSKIGDSGEVSYGFAEVVHLW